MSRLAEECLDILNEDRFQIVDPGPLHAPIHKFTLRRDDKLTLILETEADPAAKSAAIDHPPGAIRLATERARLVNIVDVEAEFIGVVPCGHTSSFSTPLPSPLRETAHVHQVKVTPGTVEDAAYTIDWLENLPPTPFVWPDIYKTEVTTTTSRLFGTSDEGVTIRNSTDRTSFSRAAVRLTIEGTTFYVCTLGRDEDPGGVKPGCIIYDGTPSELLRKKIRTALSFALGVYLVELGHSHYDRDWHIVYAMARSAYSLGRRAFELGPDQLSPLGTTFRHELGRPELTRMVLAFVNAYERLDLANLSWAYWHACAATVHIAPAHFGAAIEALQRAYIRSHPGEIHETILPREVWKALRADLVVALGRPGVSDEAARALTDKLATVNQVEQRRLLKSVMIAIGLELGADEDNAWKRRNKAAHGMPVPEGQELAAIRDMKLLRGLFHRMLLRITNAASFYFDYASPEHPCRPLEEPPPSAAELA